MRTNKVLLFASSILVSLALSACNFDFSGETTWEITADEEDALKLYEEDIKGVLEAKTITATRTTEGEEGRDVEMVNGTSSCRETDENKIWCFVLEDVYYRASLSEGEETGAYIKDKEEYDYSYRMYASDFNNFDKDDATFAYTNKGNEKTEGGVTTNEAKMTFKVSHGVNYFLVEANIVNDAITSVTFTDYAVDEEGEYTYRFSYSFSYEEVTIELPNLEGWTEETY